MAIVNHLKNRDAQRNFLEFAVGRHFVTGDVTYSYANGASPNHQVHAFNAFGEGKWDSLEGVWYKGDALAASEYHFRQGGLATSMSEVDSWFPLDVPHSRTAAIAYRLPVGMGEADTEKSPPDGVKAIAKTKWLRDFNNLGVQTDFSYSANPARALAALFFDSARLPNLPSIYADYLAYWKNRIDWGCWTEWRDYLASTETVDYTTIPDFQGFGLRAEYFNNNSLTAPAYAKRVEPVIDLQFGLGSPNYGMNVDGFSARFEGKIKAKYSETYTFTITHDDGVKLWVNDTLIIDQWGTLGTHSGTIALTAGQFYNIKIEYYEANSTANLQLRWSSASQTDEVVPSKYLYPKAEAQPRYETHLFFSAVNLITAMDAILEQCNSIRQDVNGKLRFFCLEQIASEFTFDSSNIIDDTFVFSSRDILKIDPVTEYEAVFRDSESQYLEVPVNPVTFKIDWINQAQENIEVVNLGNMTRWQARKVLQTKAKLKMARGIRCEFESLAAKAYQPMQGGIVTVNHRKLGGAKNCLILEANDKTRSEKDVSRRKFTVQEWS